MPIAEDVRKAVVDAYYPRALAVPDAARSRAQAAYTIASAIAAALVAAGVFGNLDQRPKLVQVLGVLALVGWLLAARSFLLAVAKPFQDAGESAATGADAFVRAALDKAKAESDEVDGQQGNARKWSAAATTLTVAALVAGLVDTPSGARAARITLTKAGASAVAAACGNTGHKITGTLSPDDLAKPWVSMTLDKGVCGKNAVLVSVPSAEIEAVAFTNSRHKAPLAPK